MSPGLALLANLAIGLALVVVGRSSRLVRLLSRRHATLAALPLLSGSLLSVYVFGEDSYRRNGISRWDAYTSPGGALGSMFVVSVTLMAMCAAALAYAGLAGRERLFRATAFFGGLTSLTLITVTLAGLSSS